MKRNFRKEGKEAEELAVEYLQHRGYSIVERNYRFSKKGEIDIIARDGEYLVFCEVKSRSDEEFGPPEYALTPLKQRTIRRTAEAYLALKHIQDQACRFDVVAIRLVEGRPVLTLLKNAF
ncbi:MAG: YraN family protein [Bacteroidota bacterium]